MNAPKQFKFIIIGLGLLALTSIIYKTNLLSENKNTFQADESYYITYRYFFKTGTGNTFIKTYLPKNNARQQITAQKNTLPKTIRFSTLAEGSNLRGNWLTELENSYESVSYSFLFKGKTQIFGLSKNFKPNPGGMESYLTATESIQVSAIPIGQLAKNLKQGSSSDKETIQALFNYVYNVPSAPIITLTDALSALERNEASCNGKSRLLVALARNLGYPARIKGGIILTESNKRTSHAWTELFINGTWVPFDALNGHFAYLPANYLELYEGDAFLVTHSPGIQFDYSYEINRRESLPMLNEEAEEVSKAVTFSLWGLVRNKTISKKQLFLLLVLPLGGLIVALLRNIVGIRTFGVFLPVLIAFALLETGFTTGMALFLFLILFVGLISRPFDAMGLLHTPKLVISLTLMVLVMALGNYMGISLGIAWLSSLTLFPTIILTISAERFSKLIVEDGFRKATGTLLQTLIAVSVCFLLFSVKGLDTILILFPELLLLIIAACMLLGRYVGLRWTELFRFQPLLNSKLA
ncbi:MAG: 7TM domain-containing protein [Flavobacteriaceae bacterium]